MTPSIRGRIALIFGILILGTSVCFANESLYNEARKFQRQGQLDEAINTYWNYLCQPTLKGVQSEKELAMYTDALVQLMNTFQSKGEPEECISALQEIFNSSHILQNECLRDFYSVMGYALSRTENMNKAEETTLKALTLPLHHATPERYFRDYAYAAAVFYSNTEYQKEAIDWCKEALAQAQLCKNTSGQQWVMSMLGTLYKRNGDLNAALDLFQKSIEESHSKEDDLGVLNSLSSLVDLFLFWDIPEYADMYASEAIAVEKQMKQSNPMVSAQTYINKGRALQRLGMTDSLSFYIEQARKFCASLPYNSGMVDIDLLSTGVDELQRVTKHGTAANRAKAYHRLAQTYLEQGNTKKAEVMLDSLYLTLNQHDIPAQTLRIDYKPILTHYLKKGNKEKIGQYAHMMIQEREAFKAKGLNYNLVDAIVNLQTGSKLKELKISQLRQANHHLWMMNCIVMSVIIISFILFILFRQRKRHARQIRHADAQLNSLLERLNQVNDEKEKIAREVKEFLGDKDSRQEFETLTPYVLKESGEIKFRQCFEMLYPLFLPRLRENVPSVSRREELLSMLNALKQDNKNIAELLAIAPRSVLMLRHRFRQKIGMNTEYSLENFIESLLA